MFRSVLTLGVLGLVGVFALKLILGTAVGLFFILISFAIKASAAFSPTGTATDTAMQRSPAEP